MPELVNKVHGQSKEPNAPETDNKEPANKGHDDDSIDGKGSLNALDDGQFVLLLILRSDVLSCRVFMS